MALIAHWVRSYKKKEAGRATGSTEKVFTTWR